MCYDYLKLESILPKKIQSTRSRPNASGVDKDFCDRTGKGYDGVYKEIVYASNGKRKKCIDIGIKAQSITFGQVKQLFKKNAQYQEAKANTLYPEVYKELKNMINTLYPDFKYDSITLNHNLKCIEHIDKYNTSPSIIVGFGKYWGGELVIEGTPFDIRYKPYCFNGSFLKHYTNEFMGDRWSAIFFCKQ